VDSGNVDSTTAIFKNIVLHGYVGALKLEAKRMEFLHYSMMGMVAHNAMLGQ